MRGKLLSVNCIALLLAAQIIAWPVQAASFDCAKARTHIEKMICANSKLSGLDGQLGKVYSQALEKALDPTALKKRQLDWLKELRKYCHSEMCLKGAYTTRIAAIQNGEGAKVYDTPALFAEREANQAGYIKAVLTNHTMTLSTYITAKPAQIALCKKIYLALRNGDSSIKYVEPELRTNDPVNPGLGAYNACDEREALDPDSYFTMLDLGTTGFKLYRLKYPGNPRSKSEEYLYGENPENTFRTGSANLVKVNFETCNVLDETPAYSSSPTQKYNPVYGTNTMFLYQNRYFFLDLARIGKTDKFYQLNVWEHSMEKHMFLTKNTCTWTVPLRLK